MFNKGMMWRQIAEIFLNCANPERELLEILIDLEAGYNAPHEWVQYFVTTMEKGNLLSKAFLYDWYLGDDNLGAQHWSLD